MYGEDQDIFSANNTNAGGFNVKDILHKYLSWWPLFIISFVVCFGIGILYARYSVPKYQANTLILVKSNQNGNAKGSSDLIEEALSGKQQVNLDNEIQLLRSNSLMQRIVVKNGFNISYFKKGRFLQTDLYKDVPFLLIPQNILDSSSPFSLTVTSQTVKGGTFEFGTDDNLKKFDYTWDVPFTYQGKTFVLVPNGPVTISDNIDCIATWSPVQHTIDEISGKLGIGILDSKTSIIQLSILIENQRRGEDILNALASEYNIADIEERKRISQNSILFINDRLRIVSQELSGVESDLEKYQGKNQIVDIEAQSAQSFSNSNDVTKELTQVNIQQGVVNMIQDYFSKPGDNDRLVPSTLGLEDPTLASLTAHYNELQLRRQKDASSLTSNSLALKDLNNQIADAKASIQEALKNIQRNLALQERNLRRNSMPSQQFLNSLPSKERVMQEIKRRQSITEGLYLYLLQKREETAISSTAASISNYKQIAPAQGYGPVEPQTKNIKLYSGLLGLMLPIAIIYLLDLFNDNIRSRDDITRKIKTPIIGDISHVERKKEKSLAVLGRDLVGEQFRILRTNLSFLLEKKDKQVILLTSSISNEGKTFVSINLAAVLAIPGKKVALLEFDLRKPGISKSLGLENKKGLSNYLMGQVSDLSQVYETLDEVPSLHIYRSGPIPPNPADLLLNENFTRLFQTLKENYDYVIIDSPPAGLVSDAFIFGEYADAVIYLVRQRYTKKKQLEFLNDLAKTNKLNNIGIVFNDLKTGAKYGYYGYGYNNTYGYGNTEKLPMPFFRLPFKQAEKN